MTTSSGSDDSSLSSRIRPLRDGSPIIATSSFGPPRVREESKRLVLSGNSSAAAAGASQFPSLVMAMGTTSYLDLSIASITDRAERTDTSCSPERPPKITPMRSFFGILALPSPFWERFWVRVYDCAYYALTLALSQREREFKTTK